MSKRFVIITGGECYTDGISPSIADDAFVIAADSGYDTARKLGVVPNLLVGDMDSIKNVPSDVEVYRVKAEKDDTDTMLAASIAKNRGADEIIIIGGAGGRADHWLSNIFLLESLKKDGISAKLHDGINVIRILSDEAATIPQNGGYFGILALEDSIVTATGCKYPLDRAHITRALPYCVSNEVLGEAATVTVKGKIILTESVK